MTQTADMMREIRELSVEERIDLAEAIWDSVEEDREGEEDCDLTDAQKRELERRLAAYEANPDDVIPWATVKQKLQIQAKRMANRPSHPKSSAN